MIPWLTALLVMLSAVLPVEAELYQRSRFVYKFSGRDRALVDKLDVALMKKQAYIEEALGFRLEKPVKVHLTLTRDEFNRTTRGGVPAWAGGVAYTGRNTIVVKAPLFFGQGVPLEVLAAHELAHIYLHHAVRDNYLPRWLDEGLASFLSGEARQGSLGRLSRAAAADRLMGLPRVDDVLTFSAPEADLAYAEARSAAGRLVDQYGWEGVRLLLAEIAAGGDFPDAFRTALGVDYEYWQVDWLEYARDRYRAAVLLEMDNLIWVGVVLLALAAMVAVFIRRRIQYRRWLAEEDDDYWDDSNGGPIEPG